MLPEATGMIMVDDQHKFIHHYYCLLYAGVGKKTSRLQGVYFYPDVTSFPGFWGGVG